MRFWPKSTGCCCVTAGCGTIAVTARQCVSSSSTVITDGSATITVTDSLGATVGTGATNGSGVFTATIAAAGTYTITAVKAGQTTLTVAKAFTCSANAIDVVFGRTIDVTLGPCNSGSSPVPGVRVTATKSGVVYSAFASGVNNHAIIPVADTGTYSVAIDHPRFQASAANVDVFFCAATANKTLVPATGYQCVDWNSGNASTIVGNLKCPYPWAETLYLTDSQYGTVTLNYTTSSPIGTANVWYGSLSVAVPACTPCPGGTMTLHYQVSKSSPFTSGGTPGFFPMSVVSNANGFDPGGGVCSGGSSTGVYNAEGGQVTATSDITCPPAPSVTFHGAASSRGTHCSAPTYTLTE